MEVSVSDRKKVIWEVVDNHVVDDGNNHDEIGLQGVLYWFFWKKQGGGYYRRIYWVSLFINFNEAMVWWFKESVGKDEYEGGRVKW